jgi:hypothetical protein
MIGKRRCSGTVVAGFLLYTIGGWLFAFLYFNCSQVLEIYTWWFGALADLLHGIFLLVCALPLLPLFIRAWRPSIMARPPSGSSNRQASWP